MTIPTTMRTIFCITSELLISGLFIVPGVVGRTIKNCSSAEECLEGDEDNGWCWTNGRYGSECRFDSDLSYCWVYSSWGNQDVCATCGSVCGACGSCSSTGCPQAACNYKVNIQNFFGGGYYNCLRKLYIPFCDKEDMNLAVHAGWMKKDRTSLSVEEFSEKSKPCQVSRYDAPTGNEWPRSVSVVDCSEMDIPSDVCKRKKRTVAVWLEAPNGTKSFWDSQHSALFYTGAHPMDCGASVNAYMTTIAVAGVLPLVALIIVCGCCCYCYRRQRRAHSSAGSIQDEDIVDTAPSQSIPEQEQQPKQVEPTRSDEDDVEQPPEKQSATLS